MSEFKLEMEDLLNMKLSISRTLMNTSNMETQKGLIRTLDKVDAEIKSRRSMGLNVLTLMLDNAKKLITNRVAEDPQFLWSEEGKNILDLVSAFEDRIQKERGNL